jgi:peptide deformylase
VPVTSAIAYPDPLLKRPAAAVDAFDEALALDVARLVAALAEIPAIGLAGPHLGIMRRIVAIDLASAGGPVGAQVFVNPVVTWSSPETSSFEEGSVSLPGVREHLERPARIRLAWSTPAGEPREGAFDGFMAACLQHEVDQCDGIFWLDRLSRLKRERALARHEKLIRTTRRAAAAR